MRAEDAPIEHPCDEDWDRMHPHEDGLGRHCDRCCKSVHDLSAMGAEGARDFLDRHRDESICISYLVDSRDELVFARPRPRPVAGFVPIARLAQAASLSAMLSACTPHDHGERVPIVEDPIEASDRAAPPVVIPHEVKPEPAKPVAEEPCESEPEREREPPIRRRGERNRTRGVYKPVLLGDL